MCRLFLITMCALAISAQTAGAGVLLTFDVMPGPDGRVGTADDQPFTGPTGFLQQSLQLTNQFALDGILFTPSPGVEDKNEILNSSSFSVPPLHTQPNLLASASALTIEGQFTKPVFEFSALVGISQGQDRVEIFASNGVLLGSKTGDDQVVTFQTMIPIHRFVVSAVTFDTPAIDNLFFDVPEPSGAAAVLVVGVLLCKRRRD